jgi:uncharacterized protein
MKSSLFSRSNVALFGPSLLITFGALAALAVFHGLSAVWVAAILMVIEITFSFDNAIINARTLSKMSPGWQRAFMTVGIVIAVFGMRLVFPLLVVVVASGLSWGDVWHLALHDPKKYAHELESSHTTIAAFGGFFLLMLCLQFFFDDGREVVWLARLERRMQAVGSWWTHAVVSMGVLVPVALLAGDAHVVGVAVAGAAGIGTYLVIHGLTVVSEKWYESRGITGARTGFAGLVSFIYLEVLDASFSFDGVIGAFAITTDVLLIAIGLGIGAFWVRTLTLYVVRHNALDTYRYLEHGAHYTIGVLALALLAGIYVDVPEALSGGLGIAIIGASIASSLRARSRDMRAAA